MRDSNDPPANEQMSDRAIAPALSLMIDLPMAQIVEFCDRYYLRRHEILSSAQVIYATGSSIPA
ncbi:MAG: hypothetical protein OHK0037_37630 [Elainellaceae cyanobacterium]